MDDDTQDKLVWAGYSLLILLAFSGCSSTQHESRSQEFIAQPTARAVPTWCDPRWITCNKQTPAERDGN